MSNINMSVYKDAGFSTTQMRALEALLASNESIHWIKLNEETGIYEIVLDNQMLSTYRACVSHFIEAYVGGYALKGTSGRSWYLDFGILFHKMIELYYQEFRIPGFNMIEWGTTRAISEWHEAKMDFHAEHKEYKSMGGIMGFAGLLMAYAQRFSADNERLRVIGTEIGFGRNKEVYLGSIPQQKLDSYGYLQCYLSGRIDVLVDDGLSIAPLDHKTMGSFRNDPALKFEIDEGPCGYVYAVNQILPQVLAAKDIDGATLKRSCNKIIMNFVSKALPKEGDRFKRIPIMKTDEQLESYRLRMLATADSLFRDLVRYAETGIAQRNTTACTNWHMHECMYLPVHRQNSKSNELTVLNTFFEKKPIWNTEEVGVNNENN